MMKDKTHVCSHCGATNSHFSFQCHTQRKPIKSNLQRVVPTRQEAYEQQREIMNKALNKALQKPKKQKPISPISKNRQEALRRYRRLRDKYFEEHPVCEFPDCSSTNITLHHSRGRIGSFLTDKRFFKSLCVKHHKFVEENPEEAQRLGLSKKRLDK